MHTWLHWYCIPYSSWGITLWQTHEGEAESDPVCVTLWLLSCASYRCSCFQLAVEAHLVIREISWFGLNPKQADLHPPPHNPTPSFPPSVSQHKNKHCTPLLAEGMVLRTPTVQLIPCWDVLAALNECDEALSGQRLLFWVTCQQSGRMRCAAGAWRRDEHGCGRESPCLQGGQTEWESPARRKRLPRACSS